MLVKDRCFIAFLISFILLIVVGIFRTDSLAFKKLDEESFWALKTFAKPEFDMVIMGDSRTFYGISPDAMNKVLRDYRILNFGYSLGGLNSTMYREAASKLDKKSKKKVIVLGVTPSSLIQDTKENFAFQEKKNMSKEYVYLITNFYSVRNFFRPLKPDEIIPPDFQNILRKYLKKEKLERYYREFHENGWVATQRVPEKPKKYLKPFRNIFLKTNVSEELIQDLIKQTMAWVKQGIHVYAFKPPSSKEMEKLENELSGFDEIEFSKQFEKAGGIWFSFPVEKYHSHDASHLDKKSAVQLSIDLAKCIKKNEKRIATNY